MYKYPLRAFSYNRLLKEADEKRLLRLMGLLSESEQIKMTFSYYN